MKRRVVVTGIGCITPVGIGKDKFWNSLINGTSGIDYITKFETKDFNTKIAAEVKDFNAEDYIDKERLKGWTDLFNLRLLLHEWQWKMRN